MNTVLFEAIDSLFGEYLNVWEDICNIESPTDYKAGVDAVCDYCIKKAESLGWQTDVFRHIVAGNAACITMNPEAKSSPICLSAHMDTVHPVGSFGTPAVRRDAERIYGPGVVDCKGGIAVAFLAMHALQLAGFNSRPIKLILQSDEETGSSTSGKETIKYMCDMSKDAVAFLNLEGHSFGSDELCLKRKGVLTFEFSVQGKEGHASQCASVGANAILEASHKIIELEKFKDAAKVTCCSSVIEGGSVVNTVPGKCTFKVNVRFATKDEESWIKNYCKELAERVFVPGCKTTVKIKSSRPAMELTEKNIKLLEKMNTIFEKNGLSVYRPGSRLGGSDAAYTTALGIPTVDNIGAEGGGIHSPEEYGILKSLSVMAKRIAAVISDF